MLVTQGGSGGGKKTKQREKFNGVIRLIIQLNDWPEEIYGRFYASYWKISSLKGRMECHGRQMASIKMRNSRLSTDMGANNAF